MYEDNYWIHKCNIAAEQSGFSGLIALLHGLEYGFQWQIFAGARFVGIKCVPGLSDICLYHPLREEKLPMEGFL